MTKLYNRRTLAKLTSAAVVSAVALGMGAMTPTPAKADDPIKIAYLSPSFDISDAWEHVYWAIQGRLEELEVHFEIQLLAVSTHVAHAEQLAQVEAVMFRILRFSKPGDWVI